MKHKKPQCPLSNPLNCKEYNNPNLCAFARQDGKCIKKKKVRRQKKKAAIAEK